MGVTGRKIHDLQRFSHSARYDQAKCAWKAISTQLFSVYFGIGHRITSWNSAKSEKVQQTKTSHLWGPLSRQKNNQVNVDINTRYFINKLASSAVVYWHQTGELLTTTDWNAHDVNFGSYGEGRQTGGTLKRDSTVCNFTPQPLFFLEE